MFSKLIEKERKKKQTKSVENLLRTFTFWLILFVDYVYCSDFRLFSTNNVKIHSVDAILLCDEFSFFQDSIKIVEIWIVGYFFFLTEFQISFSLQIHTTYKLANLIAGDLDANKNQWISFFGTHLSSVTCNIPKCIFGISSNKWHVICKH